VRASIDRALEEGWSMVLEGVHLVPGMLPPIDGALVVQCVLSIATVEDHSTHFLIRDLTTEGVRHHDKYVDALDDIRRIQAHIVRRAERSGVPVLENRGSVETTIGGVLELVYAGAEQVQRV
jgi:2-phosphoglycerate kinase